jgi:hypothetical protein
MAITNIAVTKIDNDFELVTQIFINIRRNGKEKKNKSTQ